MNYEKDGPSSEGDYAYREYSGQGSGKANEQSSYMRPDFYAQPREEAGDKIYPEASPAHAPYNPYAPAGYGGYGHEAAEAYRGPQSMEGYSADIGAEQRSAAERGSVEGGSKKKGGLAGVGAAIIALFTWILKFKGLALLLKFGWGAISALITIGAYSIAFGWQFAVGIVALLFIHELGHAFVLKIKGMPVGGIIFVPFLGAMTLLQRLPTNAKDDAEISIGGPIAGAISAGICLAIAELQPNPQTIWAALAYFGFFINLLNLIPVVPFDGGRVLAAVDRRVWIIGFILLLGFQIWEWINGIFSFWLILIIVLAATQFFSGRFNADSPQMKAFYTVPLSTRILISVLYFGLAAVLFLGMSIAHRMIVI